MKRRFFAVILFIAMLLVRAAAADERGERRVVDVVLVGPSEDVAAIEHSLRELLQRLGLQMRVVIADRIPAENERGAPAADVAARAWIDLRGDDVAHVEIADTRGGLVRRDVTREGTRSVLVEDVAHVVQAATESLLAFTPEKREDAGAPPPPPPPRKIEADAGAPAPSSWSFDVATFVSATPYADGAPFVVGAGAGTRIGFGADSLRPALWIFGAYHAPFGHDGTPLDLRVNVWSLRLVPALRLFDAGRFSFDAGAGGGIDVFVFSPGASAPDANVDARTEVSPILTALFATRLAITPSASAFAAATLDWDLKPRRYVAAFGDAHTPLVSPLAVRPGVALGLSFDLVGSGR